MTEIVTTRQDGVMCVGFNRPGKKNAITSDMYLALIATLQSASADASVRVVLIHGSDEVFTAGNDLADFLAWQSVAKPASHQFLDALMNFDKPLIAAVSGVAVGIGTTLLLHCDFVYASTSARLALPFVNLGVVPEAGSTYLLTRLAGHQRAAELLLLGEPFSAEKAKEVGLVNDVVAPDKLMETALATARKLAQKPPAAIRITRTLMKQGIAAAAAQANAAELKLFAERLNSPEAKEAMSAFFEKRKPDFSQFS